MCDSLVSNGRDIDTFCEVNLRLCFVRLLDFFDVCKNLLNQGQACQQSYIKFLIVLDSVFLRTYKTQVRGG